MRELEASGYRWRFQTRTPEGMLRTATLVSEQPVTADEARAMVADLSINLVEQCLTGAHEDQQNPLSHRADTGTARSDKAKHELTETPTPDESPSGTVQRSTVARCTAARSTVPRSTAAQPSKDGYKEPKGSPPNQTRPARDDPPDAGVGGGLVRSGLDRTLEQDTGDIAVEDWEILVDCLPAAMRRLEPSAVSKVARALRKRTEAGWRPEAIKATLAGNSLPPAPEIRNLAGLVGYRISQIPVNPPQRRKRSTAPTPPAAPEPSRERPLAFRLRDEARAAGHPDGQQPILWWLKKYPPGGSPDPEPPLEVAS